MPKTPKKKSERGFPGRRRSAFQEPRDRVLVACEGGKTEPRYFESLCLDKGLPRAKVVVKGPEGGTNPKSIVEFARTKYLESERDGNPFSEVWCVFDRDEHERIAEATDQAAHQPRPRGGFCVAFSNPCFELWFLLHFRYSTAHIERDEAERELRQQDRLGSYTKSMKVYSLIKDKQADAARHAARLREYHQDVNEGRPENPCTNVDEVVTYLNGLADRSDAQTACVAAGE